MRFPIDAVFLDHEGRIIKIAPNLRPWIDTARAPGAVDTLELPAGAAQRLRVGEKLYCSLT